MALESVPTVALSSKTRKSKIIIPVGIFICQCTITAELMINFGGSTDQFGRNKWSICAVSVVFQNGILKREGISVKQLQDVLGFNTPQAIYKWFNGVTMPTIDNLVILAAVLGVTIDEIIVVDEQGAKASA